ncbi:nucleotide exchange factor GrpE [Bacillus alveayuensis]|jgi:molecular chaperone GrpE|uniref:nucleotide exchange factor GrpE n=1 Tax=Aeribacillus alveayuensis TaxID=279215 RepID=UPI0005D1165E|nr:nucleotide exchange factor GrpE [Bacillus alveayuensis]
MEKELQQEEMTTYKEDTTVEAEETSEQVSEQIESVQTEEQTEEKDELTAAKERIVELEGKLQELESRYLRLHADFDNFRRRTRLDFEAAEKYRAQSLVTDILPALDNFERALKVEAEDDKTKSILQGMEMVYRSLIDALKKEGVEVIEAVGKPFDPHLHQAVMQVEDSNYEPNTVVEEFQKGYKLKDRVIRPSMVKVSQ